MYIVQVVSGLVCTLYKLYLAVFVHCTMCTVHGVSGRVCTIYIVQGVSGLLSTLYRVFMAVYVQGFS